MEKTLVTWLHLEMSVSRDLMTKQKNHRFKTKIKSETINRQVWSYLENLFKLCLSQNHSVLTQESRFL